MAKNFYVGDVNSKARKVKSFYVGDANGKARKVKKAYVGDANGKARLFYSASNPPSISYTGTYTTSNVTKDGSSYTLYTITSSGTLTIGSGDLVMVWACGGGAGGRGTSVSSGTDVLYNTGGAGGFITEGSFSSGTYSVTIGNGGSYGQDGNDTTVGNYFTAKGAKTLSNGGSYTEIFGSSGGGGGGNESQSYPGYGDGTNTIPFGIESLLPHCAGGGGGAFATTNGYPYIGGDGGSNGSNGSKNTRASSINLIYPDGGVGGNYGGGNGGIASNAGGRITTYMGHDATFYGSGGGGGGQGFDNSAERYKYTCDTGGKGYQGVVYLLVPA